MHSSSSFAAAVTSVTRRRFSSVTSRGRPGTPAPPAAPRARRKRIYLYTAAGLLGAAGSVLYAGGDVGRSGGLVRFARSLAVGATISADYWWTLEVKSRLDHGDAPPSLSELHQRCAERLVQGCLRNGGLYIKIGQGLGSLNHILPTEYISTLQRLQNECLVRGDGELDRLFSADFGCEPEQLYAEFDREPIAAASLAQVYKAVTKDGRNVAVKVQYIDLQDRFSSDVFTLRLITRLVGWFHPKFEFAWILDDIESTLRQELDFVNEARNAVRCRSDLAHLDYVHVPDVLWDLTNTRVLTTEFIDGIKINDKAALKRQGFNLADIDQKLITAFSEQIFVTGFVHADPHPGNVLVRKSAKDGSTELVLLDHGLYQTVPDNVRNSLCDFWRAIVLRDFNEMQSCAKRLSVDDYEIFAEILTQRPLHMSSAISLKTTRLSDDEVRYMTEMAQQRFDKITATLKAMPANLIFVIRNLNTVRSITREHGDPVDRLRVMVKTALRNKYGYFSMLRFELIMRYSYVRLILLRLYLRILTTLGLAPDTSVLLRQIS